jgi:chromosome segregation ATPase
LQFARNEFRIEKDQLQGLAAEHKSACEKVKQDLQNLQEAYDALEKELDEKHEELASYEEELKGTAGLVEIRKLKLEIAGLQGEIQQHELEKGDLEEQIERLQRDAAQLIDRNGQVSKERSEERKTLQTVCLGPNMLISGN